MSRIVASTEIDRPADQVFAYATDPNTFPEWQKGVVAGRHLDVVGEPRVGTRCVSTRRIGFATRPITSEITHFDPPRSWRVKGVDGPVRADVEVTVEAIDDGRSRLTIAIEFEGHGIGRAIVPVFVVPEARREMPENLAALQRRMLA